MNELKIVITIVKYIIEEIWNPNCLITRWNRLTHDDSLTRFVIHKWKNTCL